MKKSGLRITFCSLCLLGGGAVLSAQQPVDLPRSNLRLYDSLAQQIGNEVFGTIPAGDSTGVLLSVHPPELGWCVEGGLLRALGSRGLRASASSAAPYAADFAVGDMRVSYTNLRRDGIFGAKVIDRSVAMQLRAKLVDQRSGAILSTREIAAVLSDSLHVADVEKVENAAVQVTKGTVPSEGFFSNFLEPLAVLGAIGVAVFLLFHVRS